MTSPTCPKCGHGSFWCGCIETEGHTLDVWECRAMCSGQVMTEHRHEAGTAAVRADDGIPTRACVGIQARGRYKEKT